MPTTRRYVAGVLKLLAKAYGRPQWRCWGRALDVLVETILSQNTSNANSSAGYRQLRRKFRSWGRVADAPVEQVEECIRISGLSRIKAPRIQRILRQIREAPPSIACDSAHAPDRKCSPQVATSKHSRSGKALTNPAVIREEVVHGITPAKGRADRISLEFLRDWSVGDANRYLLAFDGVGPKTAACVLLFSFNMPIFPVDTHIHRIAIRMGWVQPGVTAEQTQELLTPMLAPEDRYAAHILLIAHGRQTCRAPAPGCEWCNLQTLCPYGATRLSQGR